MRDFVEYRDLERSKLLKSYIDYYSEHGIEKFIRAVKHTGVTLHPYPGDHKYAKLVNEITESITDLNDKALWKRMLEESGIINSIYKELYSSESYIKANSVDVSYSVSAFLIALEIYLSGLGERILRLEKDKKDSSDENPKKNSLVDAQIVLEIFDWVSQTASNVLTYLLYYKNGAISAKTKTLEQDIVLSIEHFNCIDRKELLDQITKDWQFDCREFHFGDNGNVYSKIIDDFYLDYCISDFRKEHLKQSFYTEFAWEEVFLEKVATSSQYNEKKSRAIILAEEFLKMYFCTDVINPSLKAQSTETHEEITIVDYLIVYSILMEMAACFIHDDQKKNTCELSDTCMQVDVDAIKQNAATQGVTEESFSRIFETLKFHKDFDCYDCPVVQIDERYFLIPTIVMNADISQVLLSRLRNYDFRGELFEKALIKLLNDNGIAANSYQMNEKGVIYQCDLLFAIKNDIFICECKSWGDDRNIRGYYDQYEKRLDAKKQLDRIADKLLEDKPKLMKILGIEKIRNIERIVVLNSAIGIHGKIGTTYLCDYSGISRFIMRKNPEWRLFDGNKLVTYSSRAYFEYSGEITYNKFMTFLNYPKPVEIMRNNTTKVVKEVDVNNIKIHIEQYRKKKELLAGGYDIEESYLKEILSSKK